jgi:hypothetical protein
VLTTGRGTGRLAAAPSSGPACSSLLIWRILTASLGAGQVSGHRTIGVIPVDDQRPGQQDVTACDAMPTEQARLTTRSMQACHEAVSDGEGLVQHWRVAGGTQLTRLGIPGAGAGLGRSRRLTSDHPRV